jgi:hypothetical protein
MHVGSKGVPSDLTFQNLLISSQVPSIYSRSVINSSEVLPCKSETSKLIIYHILIKVAVRSHECKQIIFFSLTTAR